MTHWVWQHPDWPHFFWEDKQLSSVLSRARLSQGKLLGIAQATGAKIDQNLYHTILAEQAIDTSAIEGEHLSRDSVRSSIANRLGLRQAGTTSQPDRYVDGLLDMLLDASENYQQPLTLERLCGWHAALFPTGYSGIKKITVAALRSLDPMKIVSGHAGKLKIHYEAPPAKQLPQAIATFLQWFNVTSKSIDGLLRAGIAHLWFELLHPFDDGNGRVGRALMDLALAQEEQQSLRFYSLSSAILKQRKNYYSSLEASCKGNMDITDWLLWFLDCFEKAVNTSIKLIDTIREKSRFWEIHAETEFNQRQIQVLNRLLDAGEQGFSGGMTTRKYMALTRTSRATAYRELYDLVSKKCLKPIAKKGRSASYEICC